MAQGILTQAMVTLITARRELNGAIYDPNAGTWLPATEASMAAADYAMDEIVGGVVDLIPFPITLDIMGVIQINITHDAMDATIDRINGAIKSYVTATTKVTETEPSG